MGGRHWTEEELQKLEELTGTYTVATIAKILGRSFNAVNIKLNRMGLAGFEKSTDLLTINQIRQIFSVEHKTIRKTWCSKGLRFMRKGNYLVCREENLIKFLKEHPECWNAAKVTDDSMLMRYPWYQEKKKRDIKKPYFWTPAEESKLKFLRHQGYTIREIAERMGRTELSIKAKLYYHHRREKYGIGIRSEGQSVQSSAGS